MCWMPMTTATVAGTISFDSVDASVASKSKRCCGSIWRASDNFTPYTLVSKQLILSMMLPKLFGVCCAGFEASKSKSHRIEGMLKQQSWAVDKRFSTILEPSPETTAARLVQFFVDGDTSAHFESTIVRRLWFMMKAAMLEIEGWSNMIIEGNCMWSNVTVRALWSSRIPSESSP